MSTSTAIGKILDTHVFQYLSVDVSDMPDGFEDYLDGWNDINDGYVGLHLDDSLLEDCPQMADWVVEFQKTYPGVDYILVYVDY